MEALVTSVTPLMHGGGSSYDLSDLSKSEHTQESTQSSDQCRSLNMICAPLQAEEAPSQRTVSGSLRRGRPQASLLERRDQKNIGSGRVRPVRPLLPRSDTEPTPQPKQTEWQRPQPLLPSHFAQSAWPIYFEEVPYQYEACESDVEWRRPSSESTLLYQGDRSMEQYLLERGHETRVQSISSRQPRSLSSPADHRDRCNTLGRPSMPRQITDAIFTTHPQYRDEPAFRGNADYQLFVEATFGLTPEHSRHSRSSSRSPSPISPPDYGTGRAFGIANPDECTLGPGDSITYRDCSVARVPFTFDTDDCQPRYVAGFAERTASRLDPVPSRADDVLPNYAQSQAHAVQMARMECVRRAQELQRQWRLAHR